MMMVLKYKNKKGQKNILGAIKILPLVNSLGNSAMSLILVKSLNNFFMDINVTTRERMHWKRKKEKNEMIEDRDKLT